MLDRDPCGLPYSQKLDEERETWVAAYVGSPNTDCSGNSFAIPVPANGCVGPGSTQGIGCTQRLWGKCEGHVSVSLTPAFAAQTNWAVRDKNKRCAAKAADAAATKASFAAESDSAVLYRNMLHGSACMGI